MDQLLNPVVESYFCKIMTCFDSYVRLVLSAEEASYRCEIYPDFDLFLS